MTDFINGIKSNHIEPKIWFSSDSHYYHSNILRYCDRDFSSIEEMNQTFINNWNSVVADGDIVYFLGDFAFCSVPQAKEIFQQLKGRVILCQGNHDKSPNTMLGIGFAEVYEKLFIEFCGKKILLSHYPYKQFINPDFPRKYHRQYPEWTGEDALLCGHRHSSPENKLSYIEVSGKRIAQLDVGVDAHLYHPISMDEIFSTIF